MSRTVHVEGVGQMQDDKALAKIGEYEEQIAGLERTISQHECGISECRRQVAEIKKLAEPLKKAMLRRLGAG